MDAYGAFSDPAPTGFGTSYGGGNASSGGYASQQSGGYGTSPQRQTGGGGGPPLLPEPDLGPRVSRTMQYADPYAAVRASIGGGSSTSPAGAPPSYENYQTYR